MYGRATVGKRSGFVRTSGTFSWADTSTSRILNQMCRLNGAAGQGVLPVPPAVSREAVRLVR